MGTKEEFKKKYTSTSKKTEPTESGKVEISDDAYALGELLAEIVRKMNKRGGAL